MNLAIIAKNLYKQADLKRNTQLQEHQERVRRRLAEQNALLLYHGLGSGKTLSALAATEGMPTTMVVPAALRPHYEKEIAKFTNKKTPRDIASYEAATKKMTPGEALVLDEIQRIGRHETARAKKILEHAGEYKKRLALTGTPIRNYPHELAPLLSFLHPELRIPQDPKAFDKYFLKEEKIPRTIYQWFKGLPPGVRYKPKNIQVLQGLIRGHIDYHRPAKEGYPSVTRKIKHVTMSPEQHDYYNLITQQADPVLAAKVMENMPLSKDELRGLQSFMTGARIVSNTTRPYGGSGYSPKFNHAARDFLAASMKNPRHKAVTYSNYLEGGVNEYKKLLDEHKVPSAVFHGGLSDKEKKQIIEDYNKGKIRNLLLTGAGSEGLDLKGTRAIQILEPHWNEARLKQVEGRGIRYLSHAHLPENERHVEVTRYQSLVPRSFWQKIRGVPEDIGADPYLHNLAQKKDELNRQFLNVLKQEGIRASRQNETNNRL